MAKDFSSTADLLAWYREMGMEVPLPQEVPTIVPKVPIKPAKSAPVAVAPAAVVAQAPAAAYTAKPFVAMTSPSQAVAMARALADAANSLEALKQAVFSYDACALKHTAMNTVFSDGNPEATLMLIGEAPGASEDAQGIPFCGESGKLLDAMFAAIGYDRSRFYITNSLFWRPPGNRRPTPEEVAMCLPFVEKHIALIRPKLLVLVGATAASGLLTATEGITKLRGRPHDYQNPYLDAPIPTFAIYHPSYLLRQPTQKRQAWHDLLRINHFLLS